MALVDRIILEGNISRIYYNQTDNLIWFDICKNEKYIDKNGEEQTVSSFFSAKIERSKIDNDLFKVGSWIIITGIPKSYIDKNNYKLLEEIRIRVNRPIVLKFIDCINKIEYIFIQWNIIWL